MMDDMRMRWSLWVVLLVVYNPVHILAALPSHFSTKQHGEGTYYGGSTGGKCSYYMNGQSVPTWANNMTKIALNKPQYDDSQMCGMCAEVIASGAGNGNKGPPLFVNGTPKQFTIFVDNICPECKAGDMDIGTTGDGRWDLEWTAIPCPVGSDVLSYSFIGSHNWYVKIQVKGHMYPMQKLWWWTGTTNIGGSSGQGWVELAASDDNYFVTAGTPLENKEIKEIEAGKHWVKMESWNGDVVCDRISTIKDGPMAGQGVQVGSGNVNTHCPDNPTTPPPGPGGSGSSPPPPNVQLPPPPGNPNLPTQYTGTNHGDATYYGSSGGGGKCSYKNSPPSFSSKLVEVALNAPEYADSVLCGMCAEVVADGSGSGKKGAPLFDSKGNPQPFQVFVDNICPECKKGAMDLGVSGDGRWGITWRAIPCPTNTSSEKNIQFALVGSNPYYLKLQVKNHMYPIDSLDIWQGNGNWVKLPKTPDNYFTSQGSSLSGKIGNPDNKYTVRITANTGEVVCDYLTEIKDSETIQGNGVQFGAGHDMHLCPPGEQTPPPPIPSNPPPPVATPPAPVGTPPSAQTTPPTQSTTPPSTSSTPPSTASTPPSTTPPVATPPSGSGTPPATPPSGSGTTPSSGGSPPSSSGTGCGNDKLPQQYKDTSHGEGTYYGKSTGGKCSYKDSVPEFSKNMITVALNKPEYDDSALCGMCAEVEADGTGSGKKGAPLFVNEKPVKFMVFVDNICPECKKGDMDLGTSGDGRWGIKWTAVPCPTHNSTKKHLQFSMIGSNLYYLKVQVKNHKYPVKSLDIWQGDATGWVNLPQTPDNYFSSAQSKLSGPIADDSGKYYLKITSMNGDVVCDYLTEIKDSPTIEGHGVQFGSGHDMHLCPKSQQTPPSSSASCAPSGSNNNEPSNPGSPSSNSGPSSPSSVDKPVCDTTELAKCVPAGVGNIATAANPCTATATYYNCLAKAGCYSDVHKMSCEASKQSYASLPNSGCVLNCPDASVTGGKKSKFPLLPVILGGGGVGALLLGALIACAVMSKRKKNKLSKALNEQSEYNDNGYEYEGYDGYEDYDYDGYDVEGEYDEYEY